MRLLRRREVERKTGFTYKHINTLEARGEFPRRVQLGPKAVAWVESEVDDWIAARIHQRDAGEAA